MFYITPSSGFINQVPSLHIKSTQFQIYSSHKKNVPLRKFHLLLYICIIMDILGSLKYGEVQIVFDWTLFSVTMNIRLE